MQQYRLICTQGLNFISTKHAHLLINVNKCNYHISNQMKWVMINGADWAHPEGPQSSLQGRWTHPVVHVSHTDAERYCKWAGKV